MYRVIRTITSLSNTVLLMETSVFFLNLFAMKRVKLRTLINRRHRIDLAVVITDLALVLYPSQNTGVSVCLLEKIVLVIIKIVTKMKF